MKKSVSYIAALLLTAGCATTEILQVQVTKAGEEPGTARETYLYVLPRTVLTVEVTYREVQQIPGPYWEYAERYLGIKEIIRQRSTRWQILDVRVSPHSEPDPRGFYTLSVLEGELQDDFFIPYMDQGILMDGAVMVQESLNTSGPGTLWSNDPPGFLDLGVEGNFAERTETMYKTLVTDTSYVRVPVQRTVVEQKSPATKAEEAADFLLELRTRRFEKLTGEYEVFPDGEAMEAAISKLDRLESDYLSLFAGKTLTRFAKKAYFIVPEEGYAPSRYRLDMFSEQLGFLPEELMEGLPLEVRIQPLGGSGDPGRFSLDTGGTGRYNKLIYRWPDVVEVNVTLGDDILSGHRISIFQSGPVVTGPVK